MPTPEPPASDSDSDSTPSPPPRLAVVVVNYDSWPDVERLVAALGGSPEVRAGLAWVVVVDNASPSPIPDALRTPPPGVSLVLRPENGGFAVGVNAGWRAAPGAWLLVLNPDVDAVDGLIGEALRRVDRFDAPEADPPGVVGFGLRNEDDSPQPSVGAFPTLWRTVREQFIPRSRRKYQPDRRVRPGPVPWVTGACVLLNPGMMDEIGGMDEDFFLYYEEVALCRAATDRGWRVEFDPTLSVVHLRPLQDRAISPKMRVITRHSKLLYFRKHAPARQFLTLAAIVRLEAATRGAWARVLGRSVEADAWRAVGRVARGLVEGDGPRGREVLAIADEATRGPDGRDDRRGATDAPPMP